jgi:hypothetical protein
MDIDRLQGKRIIRDGVAEEMVGWLESLLSRIQKVEAELRDQQSQHSEATKGLERFRERKRHLETVEETIDLILEKHTRTDLDVLIHFAGELRAEMVSLYRDLEQELTEE